MQFVQTSYFRANCAAVLQSVISTQRPVVVERYGIPAAILIPFEASLYKTIAESAKENQIKIEKEGEENE